MGGRCPRTTANVARAQHLPTKKAGRPISAGGEGAGGRGAAEGGRGRKVLNHNVDIIAGHQTPTFKTKPGGSRPAIISSRTLCLIPPRPIACNPLMHEPHEPHEQKNGDGVHPTMRTGRSDPAKPHARRSPEVRRARATARAEMACQQAGERTRSTGEGGRG